MEYIYAALLLHSAKKDITEDNIRKIIEAAGIAVDNI
ncbi:MAG: 50S ribosomal protein P1, partial [Ignisphaera sp.]|nr:50S ribosomal protein P1 [Ignisphaera sp.]